MTLKALQSKRDLLQNVVSQKPRIERDLAEVEAQISAHETALLPLAAKRDRVREAVAEAAKARAELPAAKVELAEAIAADERAKAGKRATAGV